MNIRAVYHHTGDGGASLPLNIRHTTMGQQLDLLRSSYSISHGYENTSRGSHRGDKVTKPPRLLGGTNEEAADLTGQRTPSNSTRSEILMQIFVKPNV